MSYKSKPIKYKVNNIFVEDSKEFENYFLKRLVSILCGNVPFEEACNIIFDSIIEDRKNESKLFERESK